MRYLLLISFLFRLLSATIIDIPADYSTIQLGIDNSSGGDTILVQPGVYEENISLDNHLLRLISTFVFTGDSAAIYETIIDGCEVSSVIVTENWDNLYNEINGFTIRNGISQYGGGIYSNESVFALKNTVLENNHCSTGGGAALFAYHSDIMIESSLIRNNRSDDVGGGIYCKTFSDLILDNVVIEQNYAGSAGGGIFSKDYCTLSITNSVFNADTSMTSGGGISCQDETELFLENVLIVSNYAEYNGGGVRIEESIADFVSVIIEGNIAGNSGSGLYVTEFSIFSGTDILIRENGMEMSHGAGFYCSVSEASLSSVNILGNTGYFGAGFFSAACDLELNHCVIGSNHSIIEGSAASIYSSNVIMNNVTIAANISQAYGEAIDVTGNTNLTINNSIIWHPGDIEISAEGYDDSPLTIEISYSDIEHLENGIELVDYCELHWYGINTSSDPLFINSAESDFYLQSSSPCIDGGDPESAVDPDGTIADIGGLFYDQSLDCLLFGDVSDDGVIDILDIILTVNCIIDGHYGCACVDMDDSGSINILDVMLIVNMIIAN